MTFELRIRKYHEYIIVQPVLDGILHQEEWLDKSEYDALVDSLREVYEDATRWQED